MGDLLKLIWYGVAGQFRSRAVLQTEVLALRHQLNVLRRRAPKRITVSNIDRLVFAGLYHLAPEVLDALKILKPETIIRWHRAGFRTWWRWRSRPRGGRPRTPDEICQLIREMSVANPLWGAPRIHGELLKLGLDVGQTTVAKYMAKRRRPPSQGWRTFVHNHADAIASIDSSWPTISFGLLYGRVLLRRYVRCSLLGCENVAKMALAKDDDVIKTFPSHRADQPSAYPLCQGDRAETGRCRECPCRMHRMKAAPYPPSRSRIT
jgi:hypothetical protein